VLTGDDFTIHDTISYDNTAPVVNRIPKGDVTVIVLDHPYIISNCVLLLQEDGVEMLRVLVSMNPQEIAAKLMLQDLTIHHKRGYNWLVQLASFLPPTMNIDIVNVRNTEFTSKKKKNSNF